MSEPARQSWQQIRDRIHQQILDSKFRPGDKLPRDEDLAAELGCSRATVQRAMQALADARIVERRRKWGTTVRPDAATRATLTIPVARHEVEASGRLYAYQMIDSYYDAAPSAVTARLRSHPADLYLHVRALHLADGETYMFEDRWISVTNVPEINDVDLRRQSANEWLVMNRPFDRCEVEISARAVSNEDVHLARFQRGGSLLTIERATWIGSKAITFVTASMAPGYRLKSTT